MTHILLNVLFVLIAIAMIVFILLQRGAGAQAGSGFGAGASGTVFGARGSANFLTSATKWLAAAFFALCLFMAWQATQAAKQQAPAEADLGVMANLPAEPANKAVESKLPVAPAAPVIAPAPAPAAAPTGQQPEPAPAEGDKGG